MPSEVILGTCEDLTVFITILQMEHSVTQHTDFAKVFFTLKMPYGLMINT